MASRREFAWSVVGTIEGLLEAWCGYRVDTGWQQKFAAESDAGRTYRLRQLFGLLPSWFIVDVMNSEGPEEACAQRLFTWLATL